MPSLNKREGMSYDESHEHVFLREGNNSSGNRLFSVLFRPSDMAVLNRTCSIALVTVLAALLYRKSSDKTRFIIRLVISILLLADEAVKQILLFSTGQFNWDYLPLHLCSINIFIVLIHVITGSRYVAEALFALCLPAAAAALLFCSWTMLPLLNLMTIHSFTVHALLFMYPVLLLAGGFRPDVKKLVRSSLLYRS